MYTKWVIISGCSGGGKTTLLEKLKFKGYTVIPEVGRQIVKNQLRIKGSITPWQEFELFGALTVEKALSIYYQALAQYSHEEIVFFDRGVLDGISYFQSLAIPQAKRYNHLITQMHYFPIVFLTPPWQAIYCHDAERRHSYQEAIVEYQRLSAFYQKIGYQIIELPKVSVSQRVDFVLSTLSIC